jgi:hypothetical protein
MEIGFNQIEKAAIILISSVRLVISVTWFSFRRSKTE